MRISVRDCRVCPLQRIPAAALAGMLLVASSPAMPDRARVEEIARMLPERPVGVGPSISDRRAWNGLARQKAFAATVDRAKAMASRPIPELTDELYLEFSETGSRAEWEVVANRRRSRLRTLVLAECIRDDGLFLEPLEDLIRSICATKTWVMPAHDRSLKNFEGESVTIDLRSSSIAWDLAMTDYLLNRNLATDVRELIGEEVRRRVLDPFARSLGDAGKHGNWWIDGANNWNAVCHAGVVGAALALEPDRGRRAAYIAAAEENLRHFLGGFGEDGYCSEGLGYWNYGFGHFILLTESVRQVTESGVDFFAMHGVREAAAFPLGLEISGGVYPAFADCGVAAKPAAHYVRYIRSRMQWFEADTAEETDEQDGDEGRGSGTAVLGPLAETLMFAFPEKWSEAPVAGADGQVQLDPLRTWFEASGVLISRVADTPFGVAVKGGHNAEHHNHNDVGSYIVVVEDRPVLLDPGPEVYTARTFSQQRYVSAVLNSFGHPVPVVAGQLQRRGRKAAGRVVRSDFTDERDTLIVDMTAAYAAESLETLERTFILDRTGKGAFTVSDHVEFAVPDHFETAVIFQGRKIDQAAGDFVLVHEDSLLRVRIDAGGLPFTTRKQRIEEDHKVPGPLRRLGIRLEEPVEEAVVTVRIQPAELTDFVESNGLLPNGNFELRAVGWSILDEGMGTIVKKDAGEGTWSLRVRDRRENDGSSIYSPLFPVRPKQDYELRGIARHLEGEGLGVYVRYYDADGEMMSDLRKEGALGALSPSDEWEPFSFSFEGEGDAAYARIWIHSYNSAEVDVLIDDLAVEED
ncbi:heparinase II/III domain-containing protein [Kiritimatiella glycovorans]|uniref:Heparinase n=1 Tax=Kiritimatiella glycovorans TaxID=1307763 RepID=A0A0G3EKE7_9BACT|nr:heparinase II/III family protein [Kiritimatiella glycovorans]AKJ64649.1 Heparinase [Kiritimatiella glycovorans]